MESGISSLDPNIHAKKMNPVIQTDFITSSPYMQTFSILIHFIYFSILVSKCMKGDVRWNIWTYLLYIMIALSSLALFTLGYSLVAHFLTVCGLYLHWTHLPQQKVSVTNKAILVTGNSLFLSHVIQCN